MTQKDKDLLLKDLCARQSWGVKVQYNNKVYAIDYVSAEYEEVKLDILDNYTVKISDIKLYLRQMSSMTKEEKKEIAIAFNYKWSHVNEMDISSDELWKSIHEPLGFSSIRYTHMANVCDYLNKKMLDYRGLIPMGLAIEVTKDNNPYRN